MAALESLYTGFDHPAADNAMATVKALNQARQIAEPEIHSRSRPTPAAASPTGSRTWPA